MQTNDIPDVLTVRQAYRAMVVFLDAYWQRTHAEDVASLLGDLQFTETDTISTADTAAWGDWLRSV
jgi:hypothetical protein